MVSPADSAPQGYWKIDSDSQVVSADAELPKGIAVKTGTLQDVSVLLEGSAYAHAFENGALTHTFLDINDYHRYHFPVSGTVREVFVIPQDDAPGGVITWDPEACRYKEYGSEQFGWQSIETRGVCVVKLDQGGYAALVPVGMCQVSSVNFEPAVRPGLHVNKGDPMGFFLFGGSDIIMIFSEDLSFELTAQPGNHILMGEALGTINR
ncbi:MAG: phosphatidylserine decarboxylase [Solobacterium sp.]|nr:phosphatidylserine decarboxylase [Solobacterium sp.]